MQKAESFSPLGDCTDAYGGRTVSRLKGDVLDIRPLLVQSRPLLIEVCGYFRRQSVSTRNVYPNPLAPLGGEPGRNGPWQVLADQHPVELAYRHHRAWIGGGVERLVAVVQVPRLQVALLDWYAKPARQSHYVVPRLTSQDVGVGRRHENAIHDDPHVAAEGFGQVAITVE